MDDAGTRRAVTDDVACGVVVDHDRSIATELHAEGAAKEASDGGMGRIHPGIDDRDADPRAVRVAERRRPVDLAEGEIATESGAGPGRERIAPGRQRDAHLRGSCRAARSAWRTSTSIQSA